MGEIGIMILTEEGKKEFLSLAYKREGYNYLFRVGKEGNIGFSENRPRLDDYQSCLNGLTHYTLLGGFNRMLGDEILGPDRDVIDIREEADIMDWSRVDVDEPVLVRDNEDAPWIRGYFAFYSGGQVYTFMSGSTSWSVEDPNFTHPWKFAKIADEEDDYE